MKRHLNRYTRKLLPREEESFCACNYCDQSLHMEQETTRNQGTHDATNAFANAHEKENPYFFLFALLCFLSNLAISFILSSSFCALYFFLSDVFSGFLRVMALEELLELPTTNLEDFLRVLDSRFCLADIRCRDSCFPLDRDAILSSSRSMLWTCRSKTSSSLRGCSSAGSSLLLRRRRLTCSSACFS